MTESMLLSAMEGAGKLIDDEALREAMAERGLGTPATRAATIEGLIDLVREMEIEGLYSPKLTGEAKTGERKTYKVYATEKLTMSPRSSPKRTCTASASASPFSSVKSRRTRSSSPSAPARPTSSKASSQLHIQPLGRHDRLRPPAPPEEKSGGEKDSQGEGIKRVDFQSTRVDRRSTLLIRRACRNHCASRSRTKRRCRRLVLPAHGMSH